MNRSRTLILGYGNPGRRDDGLGPALAAAVERLALPGVTVEAAYQLAVEDAAAVAAHDAVVFADAACRGAGPFTFRPLAAEPAAGFSTHRVGPGAVLALARELFGARAAAYVLAIRGYEFGEFGEGLSARAADNLAAALAFLVPRLRDGSLGPGAAPPDAAAVPAIGDA